jgi:hypothetical protein
MAKSPATKIIGQKTKIIGHYIMPTKKPPKPFRLRRLGQSGISYFTLPEGTAAVELQINDSKIRCLRLDKLKTLDPVRDSS